MTVQQQVAERVLTLSDEGAELVGQLLNSLDPLLFIGTGMQLPKQTDVSKRLGMGKGIIQNTEEFDSFNSEIAGLFQEF